MRAFFPRRPKASPSPTLVVVFPSPAGVGFIAVTSISFPSLLFFDSFIRSSEIFALYLPYNSRSSSLIPIEAATSLIGNIFVSCAI